eukprot:ctg_630.g267
MRPDIVALPYTQISTKLYVRRGDEGAAVEWAPGALTQLRSHRTATHQVWTAVLSFPETRQRVPVRVWRPTADAEVAVMEANGERLSWRPRSAPIVQRGLKRRREMERAVPVSVMPTEIATAAASESVSSLQAADADSVQHGLRRAARDAAAQALTRMIRSARDGRWQPLAEALQRSAQEANVHHPNADECALLKRELLATRFALLTAMAPAPPTAAAWPAAMRRHSTLVKTELPESPSSWMQHQLARFALALRQARAFARGRRRDIDPTDEPDVQQHAVLVQRMVEMLRDALVADRKTSRLAAQLLNSQWRMLLDAIDPAEAPDALKPVVRQSLECLRRDHTSTYPPPSLRALVKRAVRTGMLPDGPQPFLDAAVRLLRQQVAALPAVPHPRDAASALPLMRTTDDVLALLDGARAAARRTQREVGDAETLTELDALAEVAFQSGATGLATQIWCWIPGVSTGTTQPP